MCAITRVPDDFSRSSAIRIIGTSKVSLLVFDGWQAKARDTLNALTSPLTKGTVRVVAQS
jgi:hypothetical protein